jgi:hypothetical protein
MALDFSIIQDPIDELTMQHGQLFVQTGHTELLAIAGIILLIYTLKHGLSGGLMEFLVQFGVMFTIANLILKYYYQPLDFLHTNLSLHQIFPALADYYATQIDQGRMDILFNGMSKTLFLMEKPSIADWMMIPVAWSVEVCIWFLQAVCYGSIVLSYGALGVMNLLGPLFIPWLIVPRVNYLFWNWLQSVWQYSFYRVVATALCFVASGVWTTFESRLIHGDYSLANFVFILPKMIAITVGLIWLVLRIGTMVSDLFKGGSAAATNFLGSIASGARGVFH